MIIIGCFYALKIMYYYGQINSRKYKKLHTVDKFKQEFKKFCGNLSMEQVDAAFKAFDLSGDNKLDYDEFCKLMNNRYVDCFQMH